MNADERFSIIGTSRVLARLSPRVQRLLAEMMREERITAGTTIFEQGERAKGLLLVAEGRLSVHLARNVSLERHLGAGQLLGELGMFGQGVRTATVTAATDVVLLSLDYPRFRELLIQFPEALWTLCDVAVERIVELERELLD